MHRVYCLYRVSDLGQVEKNDIPMQRIACQTFAQKQGWTVIKEFSEKGVSGYKKTMQQRDAIQEIREDALAGKYDILLVYMFDRIGRRDDETPFAVEWLTRNGIAVWSVCEGEQRFDNHVDKLTNYIRYWQAAGESEKISERTRTRIRQLTQEGIFTGGVCPYGYELVRGKRLNKRNQPMNDLRVCESQAEVVRLIFEKAKREGLGSMRIANYLNEQGYLTGRGKRWNQSSIKRILTNHLYLGVLQKGGVESPPLPALQIIDHDTFFRVQEIMNSRRKGATENMQTIPKQTRGQFLLSGFLYCGHCGARANGTTSRKQYLRKDGALYQRDRRSYRCNASIDGVPTECDGPRTYHAERAEEVFKTAISAILTQLEALSIETILEYKYQVALRKQQMEYQEAEDILKRKRLDHETLRDEVVKALRGESAFKLNLLQSLLKETEQAIETTTAQLYEQREKLQNAELLRREVEVKQLKYHGLNQIFTNGTMEEKKMLLSVLIDRVEIKQGYELNIQLAPDFDQFLDGLIEMR